MRSDLLFYQKSDLPLLRPVAPELADGVEDDLELRVVFLLQLGPSNTEAGSNRSSRSIPRIKSGVRSKAALDRRYI